MTSGDNLLHSVSLIIKVASPCSRWEQTQRLTARHYADSEILGILGLKREVPNKLPLPQSSGNSVELWVKRVKSIRVGREKKRVRRDEGN